MALLTIDRPLDYVALLTLNRPEVRNALSPELRAQLREAVAELGRDARTRCIVITGAGDTFSAGADIRSMVDLGPYDMMRRGDEENWAALRQCAKPLIAAVSGHALGGGCELAMHCDIIVAAQSARLGQPEVRLGIMPGAGGTQNLTRAVGRFRAMLHLLTGDSLTAPEAFEAGLVSALAPDGGHLDAALAIAARIAAMPPLAVREIKRIVHAGADAPLDVALHLERRAAYMLFDTRDRGEAMRAFLEKRTPTFTAE